MSVLLMKYSGDINDDNSRFIASLSVSGEKFYHMYWTDAIEQCDVKLFKENSEFYDSDRNTVMSELERLRKWCEDRNMIEEDGRAMYARIEYLIEKMPELFEMEKGVFYIF